MKLIEDSSDLQTFVNGFAWFYEHIVQKHQLNFMQLVVQIK